MCILDVDFGRKDLGTCWEGAAGKASPEVQREVPEEAGVPCLRSSDPPQVHTPFQVCALPLKILKDSVAVSARGRGGGTGASPAKELFGPSALGLDPRHLRDGSVGASCFCTFLWQSV